MRVNTSMFLAGLSAAVAANTAGAQAPDHTSADPRMGHVEEVVVTARRREESLQDVPQTVNVLTSEQIDVHAIGNFSAALTPRESKFIDLPPEESTSYEIGTKASFLDDRGIFNLSIYRQKFDDYVFLGDNVYYINYRRVSATDVIPEVATFNFVAGVPVKVEGFEAEASFQITPHPPDSPGDRAG